MSKQERIEELVKILNEASDAYYGGQEEIMSNYEWDALFDELKNLESETGIILPDSPTQNVGADEGEGEKEPHEFPALSLAKTKLVEDLQKWSEDKKVWVSWKLDGLTLVLTYDDGKLIKILTRGDGRVGTNITYLKDFIHGIPKEIAWKGHMVVRGEGLIGLRDFEELNETLDEDEKFSNARNLASGTLSVDAAHTQLAKERHVCFIAFSCVYMEELAESGEWYESQMNWGDRMVLLEKLGFDVVPHEPCDKNGLPQMVEKFTHMVPDYGYPVDGLVVVYDDFAYSNTGSVTGHHATRAGLAFKWQDEVKETILDHVEWSCGASVITPVAIFDTVQLEGTEVSRASLVNISEMERLGIGKDRKTALKVIKANKIIPKVVGVKEAEGHFEIPAVCPVCGKPTQVKVTENQKRKVKVLVCTNPRCAAKKLKKLAKFVGKTGLDIDGLSVKTLRVFINKGYIKEASDIFYLKEHADEIRNLPGFGDKSCENLLTAIEKSRTVSAVNFLVSLSIPMIGEYAAKSILNAIGYEGFLDIVRDPSRDFTHISGIGPERSKALTDWFSDIENADAFSHLRQELDIRYEPKVREGGCAGLTFVITGDVHTFANRAAFKEYVESKGGKVTGSVSKKTDYLVNNDVQSNSEKNRKAKALGIPIITEDEFLKKF